MVSCSWHPMLKQAASVTAWSAIAGDQRLSCSSLLLPLFYTSLMGSLSMPCECVI